MTPETEQQKKIGRGLALSFHGEILRYYSENPSRKIMKDAFFDKMMKDHKFEPSFTMPRRSSFNSDSDYTQERVRVKVVRHLANYVAFMEHQY